MEKIMNRPKLQTTSLLLVFLFVMHGIHAEPKNTRQELKQQKIEKKQHKMKHKVKSYGDVVVEQSDALNLTDEQIGKIVRIQMTNKKTRKKLLNQPHKSMKKAFKELRNPAADAALIRKAGTAHTADFDAFIEAELTIRNKIDAVLTTKQRAKLKSIKLPMKTMTNE